MNKYAMLVNPEKIGKRYEIKLIPMRLPEEDTKYRRLLNSGWTQVGVVESDMQPRDIQQSIAARAIERAERLESKMTMINALSGEMFEHDAQV